MTPLFEYCVWTKDVDPNVIAQFIHNGADLNTRDQKGRTLFMYAVSNGKRFLAKILYEMGCDIHVKDNDGYKAYDYIPEAEHLRKGSPWVTISSMIDPEKWFISFGEKNGWDIRDQDGFLKLNHSLVLHSCDVYALPERLKEVRATIEMKNCKYCVSLGGIKKAYSVDLENLYELTSLEPLENVTWLKIDNCKKLSSLGNLKKLEAFSLKKNVSLSSLQNLHTVLDLNINSDKALEDLGQITEVNSLKLISASKLANINVDVKRELEISGCPNITTLKGIKNKEIGWVTLDNNQSLLDTGNITSVSRGKIRQNKKLVDVSIEKAEQLVVENNPALASLKLAKVNSLYTVGPLSSFGENLEIKKTASLKNCPPIINGIHSCKELCLCLLKKHNLLSLGQLEKIGTLKIEQKNPDLNAQLDFLETLEIDDLSINTHRLLSYNNIRQGIKDIGTHREYFLFLKKRLLESLKKKSIEKNAEYIGPTSFF